MTDDELKTAFQELRADIKALIATVATRGELALYVLKEVYNDKIGAMQDDIEDLKKRPDSAWNRNVGLLSVIGTIICTCMMVLQFISSHWR